MSKPISSDLITPIIKTCTTIHVQYVDTTTGDIVREDTLFEDATSYGKTIAQALASTSRKVNVAIGDIDSENYLIEDDDTADEDLGLYGDDPNITLLDEDFDVSGEEFTSLFEDDDDDIVEYSDEEYVDTMIDKYGRDANDNVVDLVQFMSRAR